MVSRQIIGGKNTPTFGFREHFPYNSIVASILVVLVPWI